MSQPLSLTTRLGATLASLLLCGLADLALRGLGVNAAYRASKPTPFLREDPVVAFRLRTNLDIVTSPSPALRLRGVVEQPSLPPYRVRTNALGLRHEGDVSPRKPPGTFRILCVGDSYTFGYGVNLEDTFAKVMEHELRARRKGSSVVVVNAGQPGHSSAHGLRFFETALRDIEADVLTVSYGANDYGVGIVGYASARRKLEVGSGLLQRMRCLFLHAESFVLFLRARDGLDAWLRRGRKPTFPPEAAMRGSPEGCESALADIVRLASGRGIGTAIVLTQARAPGSPHEPDYRRAAIRAAERSGAGLADVTAAVERRMAELPEPSGGWGQPPNRLFMDATHLTPEGHRVAAEEILRVLDSHYAIEP